MRISVSNIMIYRVLFVTQYYDWKLCLYSFPIEVIILQVTWTLLLQHVLLKKWNYQNFVWVQQTPSHHWETFWMYELIVSLISPCYSFRDKDAIFGTCGWRNCLERPQNTVNHQRKHHSLWNSCIAAPAISTIFVFSVFCVSLNHFNQYLSYPLGKKGCYTLGWCVFLWLFLLHQSARSKDRLFGVM